MIIMRKPAEQSYWKLCGTKPKPETTLQGTKALESGLSEMKFGAQELHTRA